MWESLIQRPPGSSSLRRLFTFVTTLIVISFVYLIANAPIASAADAEFKNGTMTYDGQTFSGPFTADGTNPKGVAKGIKYFSTPKAGDPTRATLLLLPPNKQPADATTATLQEADVSGNGRFSNLSPPKTITVGTASDSDSETAETESSCKIDGVGWIVCSMSKWIAEGVDYLYGIIAKFLMFEPLTTSGSTSSIYQLWSVVRNIANLAFIIAFILVIYSQLSGGGFSNYTVKRILPRIFIAAILVNASFWISAIAIDISNILGVSVQNIFKNSLAGVGAANTVDLPLWGDVTAAILSGTGLTIGGAVLLVSIGGTIGGLAFLLLGALIPAIFAALLAVAILAARQAIITLLVIISPLAFVAFILPNTEEWFNKWRKAFLTLLIMFPLFSAIFGGSQLIGNIIIQNARDISVALLGLTVQVVPLFLTPLLIKFSSGILGTVAGMTNDKGRGVFDRAKNWADGNRKLHQQRGLSKRPPTTTRRGNLRPTSLAQRVNNRQLYREQMTAAHQSKAEAQFAETDRGRQVHHRNKDAKLRSHAAEEASGLDWNRQVYGADGMRNSHRAGLHHAAHIHAGESKLITDRATNHAERDLQTHINNTPALRGMKIQADVDSAHAKFQASNMEAEAKMVFDGEVLASRALRNMAVQTNEFNKRAETAQADVQSRADAHWSHLSNTDPVIRQQKLNTYEASQSAKLAEEQWNTVITNIEAAGSAAPNLNAGEARIANSIKQVTEHMSIEGYAKSNADTQKQINMSKILSDNTQAIHGQSVLDYAGGIRSEEGKLSVRATAKKAASKYMLDDIQNIQDTMSYDVSTNPDAIEAEFRAATTTIQRVAYAKAVAKNGGPGIAKLKDLFTYYENLPGLNPDDLTDFKELVATEGSIMGAGKDIESWLTKSKDSAGIERSFADIHNDVGTWVNLSANAFASQNATSQSQALELLEANAPDKYIDVVDSIRNNPGALAQVKLAVRQKFSIYSDEEVDAAQRAGKPLPTPGTKMP